MKLRVKSCGRNSKKGKSREAPTLAAGLGGSSEEGAGAGGGWI